MLDFFSLSTESAVARGPFWLPFQLGYDWGTVAHNQQFVEQLLKLPSERALHSNATLMEHARITGTIIQTPRYFFKLVGYWSKLLRKPKISKRVGGKGAVPRPGEGRKGVSLREIFPKGTFLRDQFDERELGFS